MDEAKQEIMFRDALRMHAGGRPGKVALRPTKPLTTQRDLTLAYSPGVAAPCLEIARDPDLAYDYTAKGNLVAVVSNGTAVLGLGDLGPLGAKPVMEGKAVLFKRFADIDGVDIEVDTDDPETFINCVRYIGSPFGGINLEDIKAPDCFIIEQKLREVMDIPVFHDDQHGTAIITAAALLNALELTGRSIAETKMVVNGAGAAAIAGVELFKAMGLKAENVILCDSKGVIYKDRKEGMNQWKSAHAVDTDCRTLADAMKGADVFIGLSVKGAVDADMVRSMADKPLIFAMANPDPEITPEEVAQIRSDAIMATGRSDYPNQVNNVLGFPYIFRGALDVRATTINDEMKLAAARALADLAREEVPDEVDAAYSGRLLRYGPDYLIPTPFDPRLIVAVPAAVAQAAMDTGVARKPIVDMDGYRAELASRLDPTTAGLQAMFEAVRDAQRRVVFAEGEEDQSIRAAYTFRNADYGTPILVGRRDRIDAARERLGLPDLDGVDIANAAENADLTEGYADMLYERLQRLGYLRRDCQRLVNQDRNTFAACMVATGDADAMVTGLTRNSHVALNEITRVLDPRRDHPVFGLSMVVGSASTLFIADTAVHEAPKAEELADFAVAAAAFARDMGHEPRVAFVSYASFGNPMLKRAEIMRDAVRLLDEREVDFEYDGEMAVDVALNRKLMERYPFCRLSGTANVLVMPGLHSAQIATKLLNARGEDRVLGPIILGLPASAQIVPMGATVTDIVNLAVFAANQAAD
jgi:malate dehydrogenase (oxaloacetate-decarboxylating)(NADP+)